MDLKRTGEDLLTRAKEILKRDGYHSPTVLVFGQHERAIVQLEFNTPEEKYGAMYVVGRHLASTKPMCVAFVSEAWMSTRMPEQGQSIADMPDRQEVLGVAVQTRRLRIWSAVVPFVKVGQEIVFGEPIQGSDVDSYLLEEFWRGVIDGEQEVQSWTSN